MAFTFKSKVVIGWSLAGKKTVCRAEQAEI